MGGIGDLVKLVLSINFNMFTNQLFYYFMDIIDYQETLDLPLWVKWV